MVDGDMQMLMVEQSKEKGPVDHGYVNADAIGGADEHADADARW